METECSKKILGLNLVWKYRSVLFMCRPKKLSCGTSTMDRSDPRKGGQSSWLQIWWNLLRGKEATKHPYCPRFFRSFLPPLPQGGGSSCLSRLSACDMSDLSHCRAPSCLLAKLAKGNSLQTPIIIIGTILVNKSICCGPQQDREYPCSLYFNTVCPLQQSSNQHPSCFSFFKTWETFYGTSTVSQLCWSDSHSRECNSLYSKDPARHLVINHCFHITITIIVIITITIGFWYNIIISLQLRARLSPCN